MCCLSDFPFLAYSTNVYLGPLNTFPCSRVWVHLVSRGFRETLKRKKFFSPGSPVLFCQAPAVCKISPGSGAWQHTQLPWYQAAEAQVVSPVPGGQQLPPAPTTQQLPAISLPFIHSVAGPCPTRSVSQSRGAEDSSLNTLSQPYK